MVKGVPSSNWNAFSVAVSDIHLHNTIIPLFGQTLGSILFTSVIPVLLKLTCAKDGFNNIKSRKLFQSSFS